MCEDLYITEQIPHFDRRQLAEELAWHRRASLGEFRPDEGNEDDPQVSRVSARLKALEKRAQEIGITEGEIAEAWTRVEARENRYRWLARACEPV